MRVLDVDARSRGAGKTVIFATHYLEEADAYADRIVLPARGRVVADGPTTEIKAQVGSRVIRATLPDADPARSRRCPASLLLRCGFGCGKRIAEHPDSRERCLNQPPTSRIAAGILQTRDEEASAGMDADWAAPGGPELAAGSCQGAFLRAGGRSFGRRDLGGTAAL